MKNLKLLALMALAAPVMATAQVGPNPSVSGGSLDPTPGGSTDTMTAPQDARIGDAPGGNVLDRPIDSTTRPGDVGTTTGATTGSSTRATVGTGRTGASVGATTGTSTKAGTKTTTKSMNKGQRPR